MLLKMESLSKLIRPVQDAVQECLWQIEENGGHAENAETDITNQALEGSIKER